MIKNFHVLYVGQIELDNIGLAGTPANERRYSDERLREAFATARDVARTMDELGYDVLWTAEHHFQREGYECLPNLIQLGLWLATQTERLKFGCAFNVLPMWHPIRLAEDYAMADIVTDGRVIMGVGRGYHTREVETFGAPLLDADANRELFEEQLQLLLKCFNEGAFRHKGKYYECPPPVDYRGYRVEEITVVPRPQHLPVDIWMPIASGKTIDMMARYGLKAMVTLNGAEDPGRRRARLSRRVRAARPQEAARRGHDLGRRRLPGGQRGGGDPPARARARRAFQVVRAVRLRALRGRARTHLGLARRAGADAFAAGRGRAEGVVLRPAGAGDRRHQVDRRQISRARELHDPLGRRPAAQGIQGAAALVRQGRDAGVQARVTRPRAPRPTRPAPTEDSKKMKENVKRVFYVRHLAHPCYLDIIAQRPEIRLDKLENESADEVAQPIMAAAHAYQIGSTRDELKPQFHAQRAVLAHMPNLLVVSTNGAGFDTVNVKDCTEAGVLVVNQTGGNADAVASHVLAMMLTLSKQLAQTNHALRSGTMHDRTAFTGSDVHGRTIGIVGLGNVGRRVAELCRGLFRMQVIACDPYLDEQTIAARGAAKVTLDELLRRADFVSINCPLDDDSRGMIGAKRIRPDAAARLFHHHRARLHP